MHQTRFILVIVLAFFIIACSTPKKKFDKGKYDQAFELAYKKLKKGKGDRADKSVLNRSYRALVSERNDQVKLWSKTKNVDQWELAYALYDDLIKKYRDADKYLVNAQDELHQQVTKDQAFLENKIVDTLMSIGHYNLNYAIKDDKKWLAQYAYDHFIKTQYYRQIPGIDSLIQECVEYGTYIYIIDASADFAISHRWEIDRQFDNLESEDLDFINIFYDRYVNNADCDIDIRFRSLDFETTQNVKNNIFSKQVLDGYKTVIDSSGKETQEAIYKDVEASVKEIEHHKTASWECAFDVQAATHNCRIRDKYFNRSYTSTIRSYEYSGDERAIPAHYKNMPVERFEDEDEMVKELLKLIYRDIVEYMSKLN